VNYFLKNIQGEKLNQEGSAEGGNLQSMVSTFCKLNIQYLICLSLWYSYLIYDNLYIAYIYIYIYLSPSESLSLEY
jgi:hypothetical protein